MDNQQFVKKYRGHWWIPELFETNYKFYGELIFTNEKGFYLEVLEVFKPEQFSVLKEVYDKNKTINTILGFTEEGKLISLLDSFLDSYSLNIPGFQTCFFSPQIVVIGEHISGKDDIKFQFYKVYLTSLKEWFSFKDKDVLPDKQQNEYVIKIKRKCGIEGVYIEKHQMSLDFLQFNRLKFENFMMDIKILEDVFIKIERDNNFLSYNDLEKIINELI